MWQVFKNSQGSVILRGKLRDTISGNGKTGLTFSSTGLIISTIADNEASPTVYTAAGSTIETITTLGTYAAPTATKCRFKLVDNTNNPGIYELQIADARFAVAGAKSLLISVCGVSGMFDMDGLVPLWSPDPYDSSFGLSAAVLPTSPVANTWGEALVILDNMAGRIGVAQAGASTTITLDAGASAVDGRYVGYGIYLYGGTGGGVRGVGQERTIVAYVGSTKVATISSSDPWGTTPDATSKFILYPQPRANVGIWNGTVLPAQTTAGVPDVNAKQIGGQAASLNANNLLKVSMNDLLATALTETTGGNLAAAFKKLLDVATPVLTAASVNQTGDSYGRIGVAGVGLTNLGDTRIAHLDADVSSRSTYAGADTAGTTTLLSRLTSARAGYLDNLNVGGNVASHADITAINQSASRNILVATVGQYERPESGSVTYTVEVRTFSISGAAVNADSTPTVAPVGSVSGSLSANLGAGLNPATGVYRFTYTVTSGATIEQIRFDASATISSTAYTISCYSQVCDLVSVTWNSTNASNLTAIFNKLPTNNIADETVVLAAVAGVQADTTSILAKIGAFTGTGVNTVLGFLKAMFSKTASTPSDMGGTATAANDSLEAIRNRGDAAWLTGSGGGLSGANAVTLTFTDSVTHAPLQLAKVKISLNSAFDLKQTDASGVVSFTVDNGTWTIAATLNGYTFTPASLVVSGDVSQAYTMTPLAITPAPTGQTTGFSVTYDKAGNIKPGATVRYSIYDPGTAVGVVLDKTEASVVSDGNGVVQFPGLFLGVTYKFRVGATDYTQYRIPSDAGPTTQLPAIFGIPIQ